MYSVDQSDNGVNRSRGDREIMEEFLAILRSGETISGACRKMGINRDNEIRSLRRKYPDFHDSIKILRWGSHRWGAKSNPSENGYGHAITSGYYTAEQVSKEIGFPAKRLIELANAGICPHWRLDGSKPLFGMAEIKEWAYKNLITRVEGRSIPIEFVVRRFGPDSSGTTQSAFMESISGEPPPEISGVDNLFRLPLSYTRPCVYFLCLNGSVVYVGQSTSVFNRMRGHGDKEFDSVYCVPIPEESLAEVENAFICVLDPPLNQTRGGNIQYPEQIVRGLSKNRRLDFDGSRDDDSVLQWKNREANLAS